MERKSSLDLFRGSADSSFFSDLNFLEELPHDPAPVSEAVPSTLPLQQIPANQAVPIKHNRSPYHSSAALINAWPQASGRLSSQAYNRPISFPDTFLPLSNSSATRAGHSDSHPDSSSALLNDDTALGFADDCFRRESDLFLSQERTLQHDAVVINQTPPNTDSTDPAGTGEHQCCLTADLAQQLPTQGSTVSYPQAAAAAAADRKPTCSADIQASGASMQAPNSSSAEHEEGSDAFQGLQKSVSVQAADQSAELHSPHAHNTHVAETEQQQTQLPKPGTADNTNSNVDGHGALLVPKATSVKDRVAAEGAFIKAPTLAQHISSPADVLRPQASTVPAAETSLSQGVQAFEHGQASKPKLAVQDYRPDDAQASQTGIAELQTHSTSAVEPAAATTAPVEHPQKIRPPTCQPASRLSGHEGKLPGETPHSAAQQITQHPPDSISTGSPEQRQAVCRPDSGASQDTSAMLLLKQSLQSPQQTANLLLQHAKLLQQAKLIQQPHMACLANSTPPLQINSSSVAQRLPSSISNTGGGKQPGGAAASQAPSKAAAHDAGQQHNSPAAPHRAPDPAAEHRTAPATACTAALQSMLSQSPISGPCAVLAVPAVEAPALSDAAGTLSASAQQASASQPAATSPECRSLSSSPHSNHAAAIPVNAEQRQQSTDAAAPHHEHSVNISVAAGLTQPAAATAAPPALRQSPAASQPPASGSQAAVMAQSPAQPTAPESTAQLPTQFHDQSDQAEPAQPTAASGQAATDVLPGRVKRLPGGDPLEAATFRRFVDMVRSNSHDFEGQGRVLRLKQYVNSDVRPAAINAILEALAVNTLVEVLYIQNFEQGMYDEQLVKLTDVLKKGRIWALNAGENFEISMNAWKKFSEELQYTAVAYLYVSEHHLARTDLKKRMQDAIRQNRKQAPVRDSEVIKCVRNMWWNPKVPGVASKAGTGKGSGESALASLARDMVASQAGSRHSAGSNSQSRKRKAVTKEAAADTGNSVQKHGKRHCSEAPAADTVPAVQAQSSQARKQGSRLRHRTQQRVEAQPADSDADSAQHPDLAASIPDASSIRAGSMRTAARNRASTPALTAATGLAQRHNQHGHVAGNRQAVAEDLSCSHSDHEDALPDPEVLQMADNNLQPMEADQTSSPLRTRQKRKRQAAQPSPKAAAPSVPTRPTSRIRGQVLSTPVPLQSKIGKAHPQRPPQPPTGHEAADAAAEAPDSLRRTGRQRKLTAAAAAAVEDFPSLYRQPKPVAARHRPTQSVDSHGDSDYASDTAPASSSRTATRGPAKRSRAHEGAAPPGMNHVQMRQLVRYGVIPAGTHEFVYNGNQPCEVEVLPDGDILYQGDLYESLAMFGKSLLADRRGRKQSLNCWKDLTWNSQTLEMLRQTAYARHMEAKRV